MGTNRPVFVHRKGSNVKYGYYYHDYNDKQLLSHYGGKTRIQIDRLRQEYERVKALSPEEVTADSPLKIEKFKGEGTPRTYYDLNRSYFNIKPDENQIRNIISSLDKHNRWLAKHASISNPYAGDGQPKRAGFGLRVAGGVCDVTDRTAVERVVADAVHAFGGIDILVSNAGSAPQGKLHTAEGADALEKSLALNLLGHQHCAAAVSRVMLAQGTGGALLFNASKSAFNQGPDFGPYAVPKAALVALMKQYAVDLGAQQIRANAVNADRVRTALFGGGVLEARARARGLSPDEYFTQNLLGRETTAQDVAAAFAYLALAEATTGCVVPVDGGNAAAFPR